MKELIYIVAGTFQEAVFWAEEQGLQRAQWRYVSNVEVLMGVLNPVVKFVGTWYKLPNILQIQETIKVHTR